MLTKIAIPNSVDGYKKFTTVELAETILIGELMGEESKIVNRLDRNFETPLGKYLLRLRKAGMEVITVLCRLKYTGGQSFRWLLVPNT